MHRRAELLLGEKSPGVDEPIVLLALHLRSPRPIVKPFVAPEEKRGKRAAESKRVAPIVGGHETTVDADTDRAAAIGAIQRQLTIGREIRCTQSKECVRGIAATQYLIRGDRRREPLNPIEASIGQAVGNVGALRCELRLRAQ